MGGRNVAAKVQGKEGYGMDWETQWLPEMTDEELLEIALSEVEGGVEGPQQTRLGSYCNTFMVNTAVTVMVLGFCTSLPVKVRCNIGTQNDVSY